MSIGNHGDCTVTITHGHTSAHTHSMHTFDEIALVRRTQLYRAVFRASDFGACFSSPRPAPVDDSNRLPSCPAHTIPFSIRDPPGGICEHQRVFCVGKNDLCLLNATNQLPIVYYTLGS